MPSEGHRLHGFTVVSRALRLARQLLLPAVLGGASAGDTVTAAAQWILVILTVPSILVAVAQWMVFRYRLDGDELVIDSGVLSRRRRVIPLARIQNIDLEQGFLERVAGVAELRMETASGGGETEASLAVLALDEARSLQADLMRRRAEARAVAAGSAASGFEAAHGAADPTSGADVPAPDGEAAPPVPESRPLLRLSLTNLAVAGATSNEAGLIAAGLATLLEVADDATGLDPLGSWLESTVEQGLRVGAVGVIVVVAAFALGFVVLGWVLSVFVSIVRYHGFTLSRAGDELKRSYGLLSRHHSTVPLERVQAVRIEQTLLRRPLGLVALKIETAGAGPKGQGGGDAGAEAFVPIARMDQVGPLLREVFPDARFDGVPLSPVSPLARRRSFLRLAVPVALAAGLLGTFVAPRWIALLLLLGPAWLYARADYRARAWGRAPGHVLVRSGVLTRMSWVVPERKIQTLHLRATPFQRRLGLGSLVIDTAAGGRVARVVDMETTGARLLLARLAAAAESERRAALNPPAP
jgi:putative membrane protein